LDRQLMTRVPSRFRDLIRIASYVLAADQAVKRGEEDTVDLGDRWRRDFKFVVGVEDTATWNNDDLRQTLESTLSFLSDDFYTFEFVPQRESEPEQLNFGAIQDEPFLPVEGFSSVQLFSGGMDSFTGAAEELLRHGRDIILVSHRSASKTWKLQRDLIGDLRARAPGRRLMHVAVEMTKQDDRLRRERTQRSRSFLYAALAGTVAKLVGIDAIRFYENGIIGMNLPILPQVVGGRATRTTHPEVLRGFQKILSLLNEAPLKVENPFEFLTRAEVIQRLHAAGAVDLLSHTVSCAHVHKSSTMHPHCGVCSQCVDRRVSALAAGHADHDPAEGYAVDILLGKHPSDPTRRLVDIERTMVVGYVEAADRYRDIATPIEMQRRVPEVTRALLGITERYGCDADEALRRVHDLHRRHGAGVDAAIQSLYTPENIRAQRTPNGLSPDSMIAMLGARGGVGGAPNCRSDEPTLEVVPDAEYLFRRQGQTWTLRFRGSEPLLMSDSKGLRYIRFLLMQPGERLTAKALVDLDEGREVGSHPLSTSLAADQEAIDSVRATMRELKRDLADAEEFCDTDEAERLRGEIEKLEDYVKQEAGLGGKSRRESPDQKRARTAVSNAIKRAITAIGKEHDAFAKYLKRQVQTGFFLEYRDTDTPWVT
ncbi:MAG: 7-cyano-7-deazaguanine synthase, partial [Myxococcales bacterium]|nr:7-cyano-7-deazaguanine synthase [Myxococcales bacterium]